MNTIALLRPALLWLLLTLAAVSQADIVSIDMKYAQGADWKSQLRSGQIITTESSDPLHLPTLLGSDRYSPFIHLGVIEVSPEGIHVYDTTATIGKYFIGGRSPSDTMEGEVRRLPLQSFLDTARVINVYAPPTSVNTNRLISFLRQHWIAQTAFDPYFDLSDRSTLYCSQLIALGLEQAGGKRYTPAAMRYNPSLEVVRRWMKINTPKFIFPYQLTEPRNWLGTISLDYSSQAILIDRLVKYELYRRFTATQKIGNILQLTGTALSLRPAIQRFATQAHGLSSDPRFSNAALDELSRSVRAIADTTLGPAKVGNTTLPRCQLDLRSCATP